MSRKVVFDAYGGPEELHVVDTAPGMPGPGEALVRVRAAGVQPADCMIRAGRMATWMPLELPHGLGNEFAGTVEAVGEGAESASGTEVIGWISAAAYAEHVLVRADQMAAKPSEMGWAEAGALSASGQTAATALRLLGLDSGETLLIHAAAGGVGHLAVQLAVARGASVIGTAGETNHRFLESLGATPVLYGPGLTERIARLAPDGVDATLIGVGSEEAFVSSLEVTKDRGRVATIAYSELAAELGVARISTERSVAQLAGLTELWQEGRLRVEIAGTYPLEDASAAHRKVETGHVRGKVVICS